MEKFYNSTKFRNTSRVKEAVYPVYFTGNMADSVTESLEKDTAKRNMSSAVCDLSRYCRLCMKMSSFCFVCARAMPCILIKGCLTKNLAV